MKRILLSTLALGALTSAALAAERAPLTDQQMDNVTAGAITPQTTNPGGQIKDKDEVPNDNWTQQNVNPQGKPPPGQN